MLAGGVQLRLPSRPTQLVLPRGQPAHVGQVCAGQSPSSSKFILSKEKIPPGNLKRKVFETLQCTDFSLAFSPLLSQVIPWQLADASYTHPGAVQTMSKYKIFVANLHGMITAEGLGRIVNDLFGGVIAATLDTGTFQLPRDTLYVFHLWFLAKFPLFFTFWLLCINLRRLFAWNLLYWGKWIDCLVRPLIDSIESVCARSIDWLIGWFGHVLNLGSFS